MPLITLSLLFLLSVLPLSAQDNIVVSILEDVPKAHVETVTADSTPAQGSPFIVRARHWIEGIKQKMWDVDSSYCVPREYRGQIKAMDRIMYEELSMKSDDGTEIDMHSHMANYVGPGIIISPIGLSVSWDVSRQKYPDDIEGVDRKKMELGVNCYNQFFYADLFYRKTGGDFSINRYNIPGIANIFEEGSGEEIDGLGLTKIEWTGGDLNFILNHRRFSMPAAYKGNGRQLRSAGSPIVGLGYSHRLITNNVANINSFIGFLALMAAEDEGTLTNEVEEELMKSITCMMPSRLVFNEWHVSLGYSYNWVPAPHWLVNGTVTLLPAIKTAHLSNTDVLLESILRSDMEDPDLSEAERNEAAGIYDEAIFDTRKAFLDYGAIVRLSAAWSRKQWKLGVNAIVNTSRFNVRPVNVSSTLYAFNFYVGYNFWEKGKKFTLRRQSK